MGGSKAGIILALSVLAGPAEPSSDTPKAVVAAADDPRPELVALKEVNTDDMESGPWITPDGLNLYWTVFSHRLGPVVWTAKRPNARAAFEKPERLFPGAYPSLTADGLVMVLSRRGVLRITRRTTIDQPFPRPVDIPELQDERYCRRACLSEDGLALYFERLRGRPGGGVELCVVRRRSATSPWERPEPIPIDGAKARSLKMVCPFVFRNGSVLLCADDRKLGSQTSNFLVWTKSRPDGPFDTYESLRFEGLTAFGHCPRYVESTGELFFSSDRTARGTPGEARPDLFVIKNLRLPLDPKSSATGSSR